MNENENKTQKLTGPDSTPAYLGTDKAPGTKPKPSKHATKNRVKVLHMVTGLDLIGSATSLQAGRKYDIEATAVGLKAISRKTKRIIVIPYSNIRGFELFPETEEDAA